MRLFFYYPLNERPSGGHKQVRLFVRLLRQCGADALLLRDAATRRAGFDDNVYYNEPVPEAPFADDEAAAHLRPEDVVVFPEVCVFRMLNFAGAWKCRRVVFVQGGFLALRDCPFGPEVWGQAEFVLAVSPYIAMLLRHYFEVDARRLFVVPPWVVRGPFQPQPLAATERQLAVCCMPRKMPEVIREVRERVMQVHPDVPWVEIDGVPEAEVAERLRKNAIFFSTQDREGFGLPALEAMACGALVAGFAGTGAFPHPYATPRNGLWAPDRDARRAAERVCEAVEVVRGGGARLAGLRSEARAALEDFTEDAVRRGLNDLLRVVRNQSYDTRANPVPAPTLRQRLFAQSLLCEFGRSPRLQRLLGWTSWLRRSASSGKGR
jgi:glycosyltransferase involved in cell wall biosynthesis